MREEEDGRGKTQETREKRAEGRGKL